METHSAKHSKETLFGVLIVILGLAIMIVNSSVWFIGFAIQVVGALMIADGTNIKKEHFR